MAFKNISFSVALTATAIILFIAATTVNGQAKDPCEVAADKPLCIDMTKGAKTWPDAMTNALQSIIQKADIGKNVVDVIPKKLSPSLQPQSKESIESTCKDAFQNIIDNSKQSIGYVKSGDIDSLKTYLSAIGYVDCIDGLNEFGQSLPEVSQFNTEIRKFGDTLMAIANTKN